MIPSSKDAHCGNNNNHTKNIDKQKRSVRKKVRSLLGACRVYNMKKIETKISSCRYGCMLIEWCPCVSVARKTLAVVLLIPPKEVTNQEYLAFLPPKRHYEKKLPIYPCTSSETGYSEPNSRPFSRKVADRGYSCMCYHSSSRKVSHNQPCHRSMILS